MSDVSTSLQAVRNVFLDHVQDLAGVSISGWAERARISRPNLSAYLSGRTSPRLDTVGRLLAAVDLDLAAAPTIREVTVPSANGSPLRVLTAFPRLSVRAALAPARLPEGVDDKGRTRYNLTERSDRRDYYRFILRRSLLDEVREHADAALVADVWSELNLPPQLKAAWGPALLRS